MSEPIVMTVLGPVAPEELGKTITHEHCLVDVAVWFNEPDDPELRATMDAPVDMSLLSDLRQRPFSVTRDNMVLDDEPTAITELTQFANAGGRTVVDVTPDGLGRDGDALRRISRATGLHIVMGTSFYVENAHPAWIADATPDDIAAFFVRDIREGADGTGPRCGLIGEIGVAGIPRNGGRRKIGAITPEEEKVLRGAARASLRTGQTIGVHIDPVPPRAGLPVIDVLEDEGVDPSRIVINHMDQINDLDYHFSVAARGVYVEYDSLGRDLFTREWGHAFDWGHDSWRIRFAKRLIDAGHGDRLLFSQDVCLKTDLRKFGGPGYSHVLRNIVPSLEALGVAPEAIERILVENPARALAFRDDG